MIRARLPIGAYGARFVRESWTRTVHLRMRKHMNSTSDHPEKAVGDKASRREFEPAYLALHRSGELSGRIQALRAMMGPCRLCPRACGVDRLKGEKGFCGATGLRLDHRLLWRAFW